MLLTALAAMMTSGHVIACAPPAGFSDTPHPELTPDLSLVTHIERIEVARSLAVVREAASRPLEDQIKKSDDLPGIGGSHMLTPGEFGAVGSRRLNCLTDGSTLVEQVLRSDGGRFRYIVWNYTSEKAEAVKFGIGEFFYEPLPDDHTRITWTYSFALHEDKFPGSMGGLGRFLFRKFFLEGDYAQMMRGVLASIKAAAEAGAVESRP